MAHQPRDVADGDTVSTRQLWHMGLAANPNLIAQDLPSKATRRRRSLGELTPSSTNTIEFRPGILSTETIQEQLNVAQPSALNLNTVGLVKLVSLPLYCRKASDEDKDLHPEIYFQKHLNHAIKRHAQFLEKSVDKGVLKNNLCRCAKSVGLHLPESSVSRRGLFARQAQSESQGFPLSALAAAKAGTITKANPVTAANSLGLHIEANDVLYFAKIQVGTPPSTFRLIADTGSADTWLHLDDCRNIKDPLRDCNHPTLNPESSTFKRTKDPFKITY
ncbi:hypothetical protein PCANC_16099 [Puccinia coronata f. sp. avenae]|uniref:Peptidase A1 domain-containing protein n=1 Tax=Puccinia coronata f. sp. avenae TaxID=200324 RepID=A0A2N5UE87_9BASI|nr:hypothetical protein PCANC_16099 [Puccinia coronata f. sp. avenae]